MIVETFLLSTAEAVLRQEAIATEETKNAISVAYRLGGIEDTYWLSCNRFSGRMRTTVINPRELLVLSELNP